MFFDSGLFCPARGSPPSQVALFVNNLDFNFFFAGFFRSVVELQPDLLQMESHTLLTQVGKVQPKPHCMILFFFTAYLFTQYVIKNWTLSLTNASDIEEGIKMELVLKRRIMNAVLTIYLPTALVSGVLHVVHP